MNKVILMGRLGADPEFRTSGGNGILKMRVATTERFKDKDGNWTDRAEWHSVTCFGKRAEGLAKCLSKGSQVLIDGCLRTSSYEKDGDKRYKTEIIANEVELCGGKRDGDSAPRQRSGGGSAKHTAPKDDDDWSPPMVDDDDNLPF